VSTFELPCAVNQLKRPPRAHQIPSAIHEAPAALGQLRRLQPEGEWDIKKANLYKITYFFLLFNRN